MILLDTDHVTVMQYARGDRYVKLLGRIDAIPQYEFVAVPVIAVEEQMRGWMAAIAKEKQAVRQVASYRELALLFRFFARFPDHRF